MSRHVSGAVRDSRGVAVVEFAIIAPVLLLLLGGLVDFSLAFWNKRVLADSVAQGAQYASLVGSGVAVGAVQTIVRRKLSLPASGVSVTGPGCYCVAGAPATATTQPCANTCPDGAPPGLYVVIAARYTYTPILPFYSGLADPALTETAMVRLR